VRRRIVLAMAFIAVVGVVVLGIPLAIVASRIAHNEAQRRVDQEATAVAFAIDDVLEAHHTVSAQKLDTLAHDGRVVLTLAGGTRVTGGEQPAGASISASAKTGRGATVRLTVPSDDVNDRALGSVLLVAGLGALGVASAVVLAFVLSGRLAAPLRNLAATSRRLGDGDLSARADHFGIAEPDAVADALHDSAERIGSLVQAEREFSANASHQLRTPLTALRMHLEELAATSGGEPEREEIDAALEQADRLGATITDLLALARGGRTGPRVDTDAGTLVTGRVEVWRKLFGDTGRAVVLDAAPGCAARIAPGALAQALDALLDNVLQHGGGDATVTVRRGPDGLVRIQVSDGGPGIEPGTERSIFERHVSLRGGTGVGLALARTLVEADGGRLELVAAHPATFEILLR
jgi:signal transduction histidine kinase